MAAVLTLVQSKQTRINIHKRNNTKHSKYEYTYHQNAHTLQNPHITKPVKTTTAQDTHQMSHNTIKYLQYKVTLTYRALLFPGFIVDPRHFKIKFLQIYHVTPHHYTSHYVTYLHSVPT